MRNHILTYRLGKANPMSAEGIDEQLISLSLPLGLAPQFSNSKYGCCGEHTQGDRSSQYSPPAGVHDVVQSLPLNEGRTCTSLRTHQNMAKRMGCHSWDCDNTVRLHFGRLEPHTLLAGFEEASCHVMKAPRGKEL